MPTAMYDVKDLPARLDEMLAVVAAGTEVVLTDGETPRARLLPPAEPVPRAGDLGPPRILGIHAGLPFYVADDFDAELPDSFWFGDE